MTLTNYFVKEYAKHADIIVAKYCSRIYLVENDFSARALITFLVRILSHWPTPTCIQARSSPIIPLLSLLENLLGFNLGLHIREPLSQLSISHMNNNAIDIYSVVFFQKVCS